MSVIKTPTVESSDEEYGEQNSKMTPWFPPPGIHALAESCPLSEEEAVTCFYATEHGKGDGIVTPVIVLRYISHHLIHKKGTNLKLYYLLKKKNVCGPTGPANWS